MKAWMQGSRRGAMLWLGLLLCVATMLPIQGVHAAEATTDSPVVQAGGRFTVRGSGFDRNEQVVTWASSARGQVIPTQSAGADSSGNVTIQIQTDRYWEANWWAITLFGMTSERTAIARYQILAAPPDGTLVVNPNPVAAGKRVNFRGDGFRPNESVSIWATRPDGSATEFPTEVGQSGGSVFFYFDVPGDAVAGRWSMTAYGRSSNRMLVADFMVTR